MAPARPVIIIAAPSEAGIEYLLPNCTRGLSVKAMINASTIGTKKDLAKYKAAQSKIAVIILVNWRTLGINLFRVWAGKPFVSGGSTILSICCLLYTSP